MSNKMSDEACVQMAKPSGSCLIYKNRHTLITSFGHL